MSLPCSLPPCVLHQPPWLGPRGREKLAYQEWFFCLWFGKNSQKEVIRVYLTIEIGIYERSHSAVFCWRMEILVYVSHKLVPVCLSGCVDN